MTPPTGELIFGKYELRERIAVGGMGEVFLGRQMGVPGFERPVILKKLLPSLAEEKELVEQFLDEARVAATLNHPNVVSIYEVGKWNGVYVLAMEYIRGRDLARIQRHALELGVRVPPMEAAQIIRDAALGLDHAHHATGADGQPLNIVHRDVSPQNIMVRDDGVTKVVDFGIAVAANRATRTATGLVKGKLAYMAPEQARGEPVTASCDQYALGVVLWELLAGRRLFKHQDELELVRLVTQSRVPPPSSVAPVPEVLEQITLRMLSAAPEGRFPRCGAVADALSDFLGHEDNRTRSGVISLVRRSMDAEAAAASSLKPGDGNFVLKLSEPASQSLQIAVGTMELASPLPLSADPPRVPTRLTAVDRPDPAHRAAPARRRGWVPALAGLLLLVVGGGAGLAAWNQRAKVEPQIVTPPVDAPPVTPPVVAPPVENPPSPPVTAPGVVPDALAGLRIEAPAGARVRLNGRPLGSGPATATGLDPSVKHYVVVEKAGFKPFELEVSLTAGKTLKLPVELTALPRGKKAPAVNEPAVTAVPVTTTLTLDTNPWSQVYLGKDSWGLTPIPARKLAPGRYVFRFVNEVEGIDTQRTIEVAPGPNARTVDVRK